MIRTVILRHVETGATCTIETALNDEFLEHIFPGWQVIARH